MRDAKGVHTIRDSCYHKEKSAEEIQWGGCGGGGWQQTRQKYDKSPTPTIYTIGLVSSVTIMYFAS